MVFGNANYGQMGLGGEGIHTIPYDHPVAIPSILDAVAISAGTDFCLVLLRSGAVLAFGNMVRRLFDGIENPARYSRPVPLPGINDAVRIANGSEFLLILRATGELLYWRLDGTPPTVFPTTVGDHVENIVVGDSDFAISYRSGSFQLYTPDESGVGYTLRPLVA